MTLQIVSIGNEILKNIPGNFDFFSGGSASLIRGRRRR